MTESGPRIALLFGDGELGDQLRLALQEHGARIVHEGNVLSLSKGALQECEADVVVVNLDDEDDAALDQLYDVIDGDSPRVVFNDGQASRALAGWDRARWARHLAVKVLASADIDMPRPLNASGLVARSTIEETASDANVAAVWGMSEAVSAEADDDFGLDASPAVYPAHVASDDGDSESLEAELEALLASDALATDEGEFGSGLRYFEDEPALREDAFDEPAVGDDASISFDSQSVSLSNDDDFTASEMASAQDFAFDHLPSDLSMADGDLPAAANQVSAKVVSAPDSWALLDDDALVGSLTAGNTPSTTDFGVVKQSAEAFLSPEVENAAPSTEPVMSLQLLSIEEAVAPQPYAHEMHLDDDTRRLDRIVLMGAAADSVGSVCDFLSALPRDTELTFLLTQHFGAQSTDSLMNLLAASGPLPVRAVANGDVARPGELLVAPAARQVFVRRDGGLELRGDESRPGSDPSIDANFSTVANIFGRNVVAIVFAGSSTDAVAGAQAVHDLGGEVWVESSSDAQYSDMVGGIAAERLVSFSGTPHELAAHLIEVYS